MIYTATQNPTKSEIPLFKENKIGHMQSVEIGDVPIYLTQATEKSLYSHALERNIQDFAHAQLNNTYVRMTNAPRNVMKEISHLTRTMELPTAVFHFESLSSTNETALRSFNLGQDPNDKGAWIGSPHSHHVGSIFRMGPIQKGFRPGLVNHLGYLAYIQAVRGIQILSYAGRAGYFGDKSNVLFFTNDVTDINDTKIQVPTLLGTKEVDFGPMQFNAPYAYSLSPQCAVMAAPLDTRKQLDGFFTDLQTLVLPGSVNMHFFPYFHGLLDADKDFTYEIFNKYLMNCVSDSVEGVQAQRKLLRAGFRNLAPTRSGKLLSHIYYCLDLAMEQSGKCTIVVENGVYNGTIIAFRDALSFKHLGVKYDPKDHDGIKEELGELGKHDINLKKIVQKFNALLDDEGRPRYEFIPADIDSSFKLMSTFMKVDFSMFDAADKSSIGNLLSDLRFNFNAPVKDNKAVMDFLSFLSNGDISILKDYAFQISPALVNNLTPLFIGLSIFGSRVPSLNWGGREGLIFSIPKEGQNDINVIGNPRPLQFLPLKFTNFSAAYVDWKNLIESGSMSFGKGRKGKKEFVNANAVDLRISGEPEFTDAYRMLKNIVNAARKAGGEGRKRVNPDRDDGAKKRQKKSAADVGADL